MIDVEDLVTTCLAMRAAHPEIPARMILDAVMLNGRGRALKNQPSLRGEPGWLGPDTRFAGLLREALACTEIEPDFISVLHDPDPEVRKIFADLWRRAVVNRFARAYLGAHQNLTDSRG